MRWEGPAFWERDMVLDPEIVRRGFEPRRMFQWRVSDAGRGGRKAVPPLPAISAYSEMPFL